MRVADPYELRCYSPSSSPVLLLLLLLPRRYEEVHIPGVKHPWGDNEKKVAIADLPAWAQKGFGGGYTHLNRVQSRLWETALKTSENMYVQISPVCLKHVLSLFKL